MRLTARDAPEPPTVRIHDRVREELREQTLPTRVRLDGTPMRIALATRLLERHAPDTAIADDGTPVRLWSLEEYGGAILSHLLERTPLPSAHRLLHTVPDAVQHAYARANGIPEDTQAMDDATLMLTRIAAVQPQAPFTLVRSARRLTPTGYPPDSAPQRTSTPTHPDQG